MASEITIGFTIIRLDEVESTNTYASQLMKNGNVSEGTVILAEFQIHGRGQKGNTWESERGKNLTFSIVLMPGFLGVQKHFYLLMSLSLGIIDVLTHYGLKAIIKWPNDIYVSGRKIGGILIENSIKGSRLISSVAGIGLNVNQTTFACRGSNPTSMKLELRKEFDREALFKTALKHLTGWVRILYRKEWQLIKDRYLQNLLYFNEWKEFTDSAGAFPGRITDILESGELLVEKQNSKCHPYRFREIEYRS
ncbi:MAG: biotin--[acetyl-CoA-carboxylase] ligase [Bacteroidales bacterium]|nr:biotin--[acetyl-CoA-carboxylase] ligase [Bacteroidales bacterium]